MSDIPDLRMDSKSAKLIDWNPGHTIHVLQPSFPLNALVVVAILTAGIFGTISWFITYDIRITALAAIVPAIGMVYYLRKQMPGREVIFEWNEATVEWYAGRTHGTGEMIDISELSLRTENGKNWDRGDVNSSFQRDRGGTVYRGILEMTLADTKVVILESPWAEFEKDGERRLTPFATALAEALDIPLTQNNPA